MNQEVTVHYTDALIRQAAKHFFVRFASFNVAVGLVMILLGFLFWVVFKLDWFYPPILVACGILLVILYLGAGWMYTRHSTARFRAMSNPIVVWQFKDDGFVTKSEIGSAELKWKAISEVWSYPGVWLLFFGSRGSGYSTLPTQDIPGELQEYVISRIKANGGKVS